MGAGIRNGTLGTLPRHACFVRKSVSRIIIIDGNWMSSEARLGTAQYTPTLSFDRW